MFSAEAKSSSARTARLLFSSLGKKSGAGSGELSNFSIHSSRNIHEDYAARLLLKCLRRAVYKRKREMLRTPSPRVCHSSTAMSSGERKDDGSADNDIEITVPHDDISVSDASIDVVESADSHPLSQVDSDISIQPIRKNVVSLPSIQAPLRVIGKRTPANVTEFLECCDTTSVRVVDDIGASLSLPKKQLSTISDPQYQALGTVPVYQAVMASNSEASAETIPNGLPPVSVCTPLSTASPQPESSQGDDTSSDASPENTSVAVENLPHLATEERPGEVAADAAVSDIPSNRAPITSNPDIVAPVIIVPSSLHEGTKQETGVVHAPDEIRSAPGASDRDMQFHSATLPPTLPVTNAEQHPEKKENLPECSDAEVKIQNVANLRTGADGETERVAVLPLRHLSDSITRKISPDMWPEVGDGRKNDSPCVDTGQNVEELLSKLAARNIDMNHSAVIPDFDELSGSGTDSSVESLRELADLANHITSFSGNEKIHFQAVRTTSEDDDLYDF